MSRQPVSSSRLNPIGNARALHQINNSVRQLQFMETHSQTLLDTLNVRLEITYARAPIRGNTKGDVYRLKRDRCNPRGGERQLEQWIWAQWKCHDPSTKGRPFLDGVCPFIQTYQMPLQGSRRDTGWGKIDLVGATPGLLPVVIELKHGAGRDTPLRMLVEGLAYACAVRKAWNEGGLRAEWLQFVDKQRSQQPIEIVEVPIILLAPKDYWERAIGKPGKRTEGKVPERAWPVLVKLVARCKLHGFPIHFAQFEINDNTGQSALKISDVSVLELPGSGSSEMG